VLQPVNITDGSYYPRFLLHCDSNFDSPAHFSHHCNLMPDKPHYGLQNFTSTLEATAFSPQCLPGQTRLDYTLVLDSSSADVNVIKREATRPLIPGVRQIVAALFDEESFFRGYYENFYNSWANQL
jgi:hypothetical protein